MGWTWPDDLAEAAWGLIANAWDGNWEKAGKEWREAAVRWRDAYHESIRQSTHEPKRPEKLFE